MKYQATFSQAITRMASFELQASCDEAALSRAELLLSQLNDGTSVYLRDSNWTEVTHLYELADLEVSP